MVRVQGWQGVAALLGVLSWLAGAEPLGAQPAEPAEMPSVLARKLDDLTAKSGVRGEAPFVKDALLLGTHNVYVADDRPQALLLRELPRQALLLAARDELGLATRDASLREPFPEGEAGTTGAVELASLVSTRPEGSQLDVVLFRRMDGKIEILFSRVIPLQGEIIEALATVCEELSRTVFVEVLKQAGYDGQAHKADGPNTVSSTALKQSRELSDIAQYNAIRRLHGSLRETGESPARLSLLARCYAHLGSLTDYLFSSAHKVFKARALLYAERLTARTKASPEALWTRAYVRAIVGRHQAALDDIAAAREKHNSAADKPASEPAWGKAIEAYCRFDRSGLQKLAKSEALRGLAGYLEFLAAEHTNNQSTMMEPIQKVLRLHPECLRATAAMFQINALGPRRMAGPAAFEIFARSFPKRLKQVPELSPELQEQAQSLQEDGAGQDFEARRALLDALLAAGSPEQDRSEPSLATLARLSEEAGLMHALWQLHANKYVLGVAVDDEVALFEPLFGDHPLGDALRSFGWQRSEVVTAGDVLKNSLITSDAQYSQQMLALHLDGLGVAVSRHWFFLCRQYNDALVGDLLQHIASTGDMDYRMTVALGLKTASPNSPLLIEARIRKEWPEAEPLAAAWEKQFADVPSFLETLGNQYYSSRRWEDAERVWKRRIKLSPDISSYQQLAEIYRSQGRTEDWLTALKQALEQPALGLEHTQVSVQLANHYMSRDELELALPYAEAAASSYAGWGMQAAVECHTRLENWKEAEQWVQRISERYDGSILEWCLWCARTGQGDLKAARNLARRHYEALRPPVAPDTLMHIGVFYLIGDEDEKALQVLQAAFEQDGNPYTGLHGAVVADRLQQPKLRDELIEQAIQKGKTFRFEGLQGAVRQQMVEAAVMLQQHFRTQAAAKNFDLTALQILESQPALGEPTNIDYFVGQFLLNQGGDAEGRQLLVRCATSPVAKTNRSLAEVALRKLELDVPPRRTVELDRAEIGKGLPDRSVVEWALGAGLSVVVGDGKREWRISKKEELTTGFFMVKVLDVRGYQAFNDEDFQRLNGLKGLREFYVARTKATGKGLASLANIPALTTLDAASLEMTDEDTQVLATLPNLQVLYLAAEDGKGKLTDAALRSVSKLTSLRLLDIRGHEFTDAGLAELAGLTRLEHLNVCNERHPLPDFTDAGLVHFARMQSLQVLLIGYAGITDAGVKHLEPLVKLQHLSLAGTKVTNAAVSDLAKLKQLRDLTLDFCPIDDEGLQGLTRLPELKNLCLRDTKVTDAGVESILRMKSPSQLVLERTGITPAGLRRLKAAFPDCQIYPRPE